MQLKLYQRLNKISVAIFISLIVFILLISFFNKELQPHRPYVIGGFVLYSVLSFLGFKTLEKNWFRKKIIRMATQNQIALAKIKTAIPYRIIRDSSLIQYQLWKIDIDLYDQQFHKTSMTIYERMNVDLKTIPQGNVYVTYNPEKPEEIFILQNVMIGHLLNLQPIVTAYENQKTINIHYLNVYYKNGLIIETFKESLKES